MDNEITQEELQDLKREEFLSNENKIRNKPTFDLQKYASDVFLKGTMAFYRKTLTNQSQKPTK